MDAINEKAMINRKASDKAKEAGKCYESMSIRSSSVGSGSFLVSGGRAQGEGRNRTRARLSLSGMYLRGRKSGGRDAMAAREISYDRSSDEEVVGLDSGRGSDSSSDKSRSRRTIRSFSGSYHEIFFI